MSNLATGELTSPYPREIALNAKTMRPKPKPLGIRVAADIWTLLIGGFYAVLCLIPHWGISVLLAIGFAWRAFRVERMKVDFAPRAIALAFLGWLVASYFLLRALMGAEGPLGSWMSRGAEDPGGGFKVEPAAVVVGTMLLLWFAAAVWRRLNRRELEPGGFYEGLRSGVAWFILPAIILGSDVVATAFIAVGRGWLITFLLVLILGVSTRLWRHLPERAGCAVAAISLFGSAWMFSVQLREGQNYANPTETVDSLAGALIVMVAVGIALYVSHRYRKNEIPLELPSMGPIPISAEAPLESETT